MKLIETVTGDFGKLAELVRRTRFLEHIKVGKLQRVCRNISLYQFEPGEIIFKQDQEPESFYIIYQGSVSVVLSKTLFNRGLKVATLGKGDFFGEAALLYDTTRAATCMCHTQVQAFVFTTNDFQVLCQSNYKFRQVLKQVAVERLVDTQKKLRAWDPKSEAASRREKAKRTREEHAKANDPQQLERKAFIAKLVDRKIFFEVEVRSSFMRVRLGPAFDPLPEEQKHSFLSVALAFAKALDGKGDELVIYDFRTGVKIGYYRTHELEIKPIPQPTQGTRKKALAPEG